ncbi:TPA: hypothetical protein QCJ61_005615 [Enterobacter asburiae]|nr:hypothetical protein [Enterobacter asburiae]HDR2791446.1 hypothetical protein [Enterobacter asburiae]HDR2802551.1 hypothetical protein [Enterobacter asburiae]HDR2807650.1 hypothetical protein [Enterobacter asburiae]HDR2807989.1 hypothetical protein [Enterobacter asburiae]
MKRELLPICVSLVLSGCVFDKDLYLGYSRPDVDGTITSAPDTIMQLLLNPAPVKVLPENTEDKKTVTQRKAIISGECSNALFTSTQEVNDGTPQKPKNYIVSGHDCLAERNNAIYTLMTGSDEICLAYRRKLYGRDAAFNISTGTLTSLFAGVATVVTPTVTKSIFSALAMFFNSERSLVNEVVYKQMILTAVDTKIQQTRDTKAQAIVQHLKDDGLDSYPLSRGIQDFMDYHNSCSFTEGLRLALAEGTQNPTENKINTLNNRMLLNNAQMNIYCSGKKDTDKQMCESLKSRNTAITNELKTLEVQ